MKRGFLFALILTGMFLLAGEALAARHCFEDDDNMEQASTIIVDVERQCRDIAAYEETDEDWVRFFAVQGSYMTIETIFIDGPSHSNMYMEIYDSEGNLKDCDEYYGFPYAKIEYTDPFPFETGFYYARILYTFCYDIVDPVACEVPAVPNLSHSYCTTYPLEEDLNYDFRVTEDSGDPASVSGQIVQSGTPVGSAVMRVYDDTADPTHYENRTANSSGWIDPPLGVTAGRWPIEIWVDGVKRYRSVHTISGVPYIPQPNGQYEIGELVVVGGGGCVPSSVAGKGRSGDAVLYVTILFAPLFFVATLLMVRRMKR